MKIPTTSIVLAAIVFLAGCGKQSVSSGTASSPVTITNPVIDTNTIWAQQRRADEITSMKGDSEASRQVCIGNLRQIAAAKNMWVISKKMQKHDVPTVADLKEYMPPGQSFSICPSGGTYEINAVGVLPICSISGHAIQATR
jgi:hypothetical protein